MNLSKLIRRYPNLVWPSVILLASFLLTLLLSLAWNADSEETPEPTRADAKASAASWELEKSLPIIPVYLTGKERVEEVPLENYVRGVVAAEMPIEFEEEALKAQAIAARTYIIRRIKEQDFSQVPVRNAWVTDSVVHQAYLSEDVLRSKWKGQAAKRNLAKLNQAVEDTRGQILLYNGKPIDAAFFSTSNGYTENAEEYWGNAVPYLRSVASPWDTALSPKYKAIVELPYRDFLKKLGLNGVVTASSAVNGTRVMEQTEGGRVKSVRIGGRTFTGREVREKLGLASSDFSWELQGSRVVITTYGYGHGVGMSQWGANGMAREGKTAYEILKHYYTGVTIGQSMETMKF